MFRFVIMGTSADCFSNAHDSVVRGNTIITSGRRHVNANKGRILRPLSALSIGIINELIRRRRVQATGRRLNGLCARAPAAKGLTYETIGILTTRTRPLRHTLCFNAMINTTRRRGAFIFIDRTIGRFLMVLTIMVNAFNGLPVRTFSTHLRLGGVLRNGFDLLRCNTLIARCRRLKRVPSDAFTEGNGGTNDKLLGTDRCLRRNKLANAVLTSGDCAIFLVSGVESIFRREDNVGFCLRSFCECRDIGRFDIRSYGNDSFRHCAVSCTRVVASGVRRERRCSHVSYKEAVTGQLPLPEIRTASVFP